MGLASYALVIAGDGTEKRAEDFRPGDTVREALTGDSVQLVNCLSGPGVGMVRLHVENGLILDMTGDQNVLSDSGMLAASRVTAGTGLRVKDGFARCEEVETLMGDYMVYDLIADNDPDTTPWIVANGLVIGLRL